jgi:hypothetical protein
VVDPTIMAVAMAMAAAVAMAVAVAVAVAAAMAMAMAPAAATTEEAPQAFVFITYTVDYLLIVLFYIKFSSRQTLSRERNYCRSREQDAVIQIGASICAVDRFTKKAKNSPLQR